ncbi:hypothetical protein HPB50_028772 [Hyalomma asiaticum]|nr:hypothetical protein HPB50_028772 [Hyalomma asiaticum]
MVRKREFVWERPPTGHVCSKQNVVTRCSRRGFFRAQGPRARLSHRHPSVLPRSPVLTRRARCAGGPWRACSEPDWAALIRCLFERAAAPNSRQGRREAGPHGAVILDPWPTPDGLAGVAAAVLPAENTTAVHRCEG